MSLLVMSLLIWAGCLVAGFLGSLTGLGGGVIVVPLLALAFGVDLRYAIGASLLSVIGTSSGAAAAYVRDGMSNIRVGMFLEVATTLGAVGGAAIAAYVAANLVAVVFGVVLLGAAAVSLRRPAERDRPERPPDPIARALRLDGSYQGIDGLRRYQVRHVPAGFGLMAVAGGLSGLLGIGSGAFKVIAMDDVMRLPFKVSSTTSNFMIGVTAAASAGVYLARGYLDPVLAGPVVLGVLPGAWLGARLLPRVRGRALRVVFAGVIVVMAAEMLYQGASGRL